MHTHSLNSGKIWEAENMYIHPFLLKGWSCQYAGFLKHFLEAKQNINSEIGSGT